MKIHLNRHLPVLGMSTLGAALSKRPGSSAHTRWDEFGFRLDDRVVPFAQAAARDDIVVIEILSQTEFHNTEGGFLEAGRYEISLPASDLILWLDPTLRASRLAGPRSA
jgi:hypothetical protein